MKSQSQRLSFFISVIIFLFFSSITELSASSRKTLFDRDWKFHRGSIANAEQPVFDDSRWRVLNLPHDWSIEPAPIQMEGITIGPFSKLNESGAGGADTGQTLGGEGWYRKEFTVAKEDEDKLISLYFEGIYNQSEIWVNGKKVYFNPYGYTSFKIDITDYCNPAGTSNVVVVRAVNVGENSRWYSGSGVYRHVWLIKTDKVHLDKWDTYVDVSQLKGKNAIGKLETVVHNKSGKKIEGNLHLKIISPTGQEVLSVSEKASSSDIPFSLDFSISNPEMWSVDNPVLYSAEISFYSDGKTYDRITIPFGIRTISFSADKGFLLNGNSLKLKGGCIHHDNGLLGAAAIDRAEERKAELLKANGFNAVRCAHNQVSEHFLNVCDRLGILVIHETFDQWQQNKRWNDYHQFFDQWSDKDLAASVRRDRNHPSIIMWSIGNEIAQRADEPEGQDIAKRLVQTVKKYDSSRFTTVGANDFWDREHLKFEWDKDIHRAFNNIDVAGYNYMWWKYENDHKAYPDRIIYGSETYPKDAALNWNLVEKYPVIIGDFVWTAIDYLGEAGLGHVSELAGGEQDTQFKGWPWYNAWCGDIDFCGDKKPQSFYRDIIWREKEISMAVRLPVTTGKKEVVNGWGWTDELLSWNWIGKEGQPMRINIYSRSPKVRLYLNDKLIGEKETGKENYTAVFEVPYQAGILKAVNLNKNKEVSSFVLKTAGEPAAIRLTADRIQIKADKDDLSYVKIEIVDKDGNVVPDATIPVNLECTGTGNIIASGNAAPDDMKSFRSLTPSTFRGKAIAIIQPNEQKGEVKLTVSAEELPQATISIQVN